MLTPDVTRAAGTGIPNGSLTQNPVERKQAAPEVITAEICGEEFTTDAEGIQRVRLEVVK